jgi:hypothetical protein
MRRELKHKGKGKESKELPEKQQIKSKIYDSEAKHRRRKGGMRDPSEILHND